MSTADLDPIPRACRLLREGAAELKNCHTLASTGHDWTGEPEAKAAYDEHMATADALERVHAECETLRTGYAAARLEIQSLQARIKTMAEEHADELTMAHLDGRMRAAQPAGAQQPGTAYVVPEVLDALNWVDDFIARCNGDDRGACESVNVLRRAFASHGQAPAQAAPQQEAASVDLKTMELAESVGLIGPASRTHDLHEAIQRFHDLICANATIKAAQMAAEAISEAAPQQETQKPAFWTVYAQYEDGGETGWIPLPGYSNETELGVKNLVMKAARKEGYKGTATERMMELGWEIRPVYLAPWAAPQPSPTPQADSQPAPDEATAMSRTGDLAEAGRWPSDWVEAYRRGYSDRASSAPADSVLEDAASAGFFLQLPQRPKPEAPAGTVGLDWDAYSGAQMLAYGRDCSNAAIVAAQKPGGL